MSEEMILEIKMTRECLEGSGSVNLEACFKCWRMKFSPLEALRMYLIATFQKEFEVI